MAKSRSRSPMWKPRPPSQRSPERNRHRQDYYHNNNDFHRDSRRSTHWEDDQHRQNNSRFDSYSHFGDNLFEQGTFDTNLRRSPFEAINRLKRVYSPERRGESNRRFPPKSPEEANYRENTRNFHNHRNHERNGDNPMVHNNGFKAARRENNFHRPYSRDHNKNWHENDGCWNQHDPANQYLSPHRRRPEEHERKSFQKRYPEDDYREHEPHHKRAREAERHDFRPPLKSSHWKDGHLERTYYTKEWSKDMEHRDPTPFVHEKHSGALIKIEYDYGHQSPTHVYTEPMLQDGHAERHSHVERHNRHEERKNESTKTSQYHKTSDSSRERRRYDDRSLEPLSKYSSKKHDNNIVSKNGIDVKQASPKHKEKIKEGDYHGRKEDEYQKDPISPLHLRSQSPQTPDPKGVLKITSEKESIVVNLDLKKSSDKYRQPHEQRNKPKHLPPSLSNPTQGQGFPEDKQILVGDIQKRSNSTSKDRQLSHDLVAVAGKETFHPVFEHLESSLVGGANATNSEFTKKIITIIHEVKANNFRSTGLSLHERFSKLQEESNKQELNLNPTPQINPEIHRRIDISLEELQSKSLHKTVEVAPGSHRLIEDPNDLRHDIERRRKQRLHSEQNGTADTSYGSSDASSSCYTHPYQETREFQSSSRVSRPPFRISTGRLPVRGAYYRGNPNQYHSSLNNFEDTDEIRKPYKGWGNPAARI